MKGVIVSLVVLLGLATGADFIARGAAERRIADRVATSLELDDEPDVDIGGWPFLVAAVDGLIPSLRIKSSNVTRRNVTLDRVTLRLVDVRFDVSELLREKGRVQIGGGEGEATMIDTAFTELLQARGAPITVRFEGTQVFVTAEQIPESVSGDVSLDDDALVVSSEHLPESYGLPLPALGRGIDYRSVAIEDGRARLVLDLGAGTLRL